MKLLITLKKSPISSLQVHKDTVAALGLRKIGQTVEKEDNPSIRGQIFRVRHMVQVQEVPGEVAKKAAPKAVKAKEAAPKTEKAVKEAAPKAEKAVKAVKETAPKAVKEAAPKAEKAAKASSGTAAKAVKDAAPKAPKKAAGGATADM